MLIQHGYFFSSSYVQENSDAAFDGVLRNVEVLCND